MLGCDSGFSMFGFQARMTRAPGLSGLEPRLKQRKKGRLARPSCSLRPLGVASPFAALRLRGLVGLGHP